MTAQNNFKLYHQDCSDILV